MSYGSASTKEGIDRESISEMTSWLEQYDFDKYAIVPDEDGFWLVGFSEDQTERLEWFKSSDDAT